MKFIIERSGYHFYSETLHINQLIEVEAESAELAEQLALMSEGNGRIRVYESESEGGITWEDCNEDIEAKCLGESDAYFELQQKLKRAKVCQIDFDSGQT